MRNISYIKFKWLDIVIIVLFSIMIVGCVSTKSLYSNKSPKQKSVCVQITESTVIKFPDKNLENAIREKIQCPTGDILKDDVDKITNLQNAKDKHIENLSGMENLTNLTLLNLSNNQISNIKPLEGLTNLTDLNLTTNKISNIEPLERLVNLTKLTLSLNQIKDYSPVYSYYKNLKRTDIISTSIIPKEELASASNQVAMNPSIISNHEVISDNSHFAISPSIIPKQDVINDNNNLTENSSIISKLKILSISDQILQSAVITFPDENLEKLIRDTLNKPTGDILKRDALKIMTLITKSSKEKYITNLSGIEDLNNLTLLNLNNNKISNIDSLKGLTDLTNLYLSNNQIKNTDIQSLKDSLPKCIIESDF